MSIARLSTLISSQKLYTLASSFECYGYDQNGDEVVIDCSAPGKDGISQEDIFGTTKGCFFRQDDVGRVEESGCGYLLIKKEFEALGISKD